MRTSECVLIRARTLIIVSVPSTTIARYYQFGSILDLKSKVTKFVVKNNATSYLLKHFNMI